MTQSIFYNLNRIKSVSSGLHASPQAIVTWVVFFSFNLSLHHCTMQSHKEQITGSKEHWCGQLWPFIWLRQQLCRAWATVASVRCERRSLTDSHHWLELTQRRDMCQCSDCSSHRAPKDGRSHRHAATAALRWVSPWLNLPSNTGCTRRTCAWERFAVCVCAPSRSSVCGCTRVSHHPDCIAIVFTSAPLSTHSSVTPHQLISPLPPLLWTYTQREKMLAAVTAVKGWVAELIYDLITCFWIQN